MTDHFVLESNKLQYLNIFNVFILDMPEQDPNKERASDCPTVTEVCEEVVHALHPVEDPQSTESTSLAIAM